MKAAIETVMNGVEYLLLKYDHCDTSFVYVPHVTVHLFEYSMPH